MVCPSDTKEEKENHTNSFDSSRSYCYTARRINSLNLRIPNLATIAKLLQPMKLTITQLGKERMLKMIAFLKELDPQKFNFGAIRKEKDCGTVGCIVGWTPTVFPEFVEYKYLKSIDFGEFKIGDIFTGYIGAGALIFEVSRDVSDCLFSPISQRVLGMENRSALITPIQAAGMLEEFLTLATVAN